MLPYFRCVRSCQSAVGAYQSFGGTRRYGISPQQEGYEITPQEGDEPMALHMSDLYVLKAGARPN
jgi:hypothetical protein